MLTFLLILGVVVIVIALLLAIAIDKAARVLNTDERNW